jgi:methyl-accepting chemotaxis protein
MTANRKRRPRRTRILIDRLQHRLLLINLFYFCAIVLVLATALLLPSLLQLRGAALDASAENLAAANEFLFLHARLWPAVLIVLGLLAFHSVIISHRIAGPLYRFRRVVEAVTAGHLSMRVKIRKHDYLTQEAQAINEMLEALERRIAGLDEQAAAVRAAFSNLKRVRNGRSADGLDETIRTLDGLVGGLQTRLDQLRSS